MFCFSHLGQCDVPPELFLSNVLCMYNLRNDKMQIPLRTSRGLNWENKTYKPKRPGNSLSSLRVRNKDLRAASQTSLARVILCLQSRVKNAMRPNYIKNIFCEQCLDPSHHTLELKCTSEGKSTVQQARHCLSTRRTSGHPGL